MICTSLVIHVNTSCLTDTVDVTECTSYALDGITFCSICSSTSTVAGLIAFSAFSCQVQNHQFYFWTSLCSASLSDEELVWLSVWSDVQIVCIWANAIPKPHRLLPHLNPDWFYLCCNQLTQVVLEKRLLNGCCVVVVVCVQLPTSADNVTLLAFAAEGCAVVCHAAAAIDQYAAQRAHNSKPATLACSGR